MSDEELRDELNRQQLARIKAERLERDKDKIAAGDMDAEGRMTGQGAQKRMDRLDAAQKRRLSIIDQKIAQTEALMAGLSGKDLARAKRRLSQHRAEKIGIEGGAERRRMRLQGLIDRDKPADTPAATTDTPAVTSDTGVTDTVTPTGENPEDPMANREKIDKVTTEDDYLDAVGRGEGDTVSGKAQFELDAIRAGGKLPEQGIVASPKSVPGIEGDVSGVRTSGYATGPKPGRPVTIEVSPDDPSGVSKIVTHSDGRKEITYKDGKVTNYDGSGQEVTGDGAAEQRPELARRERERAVTGALGDRGREQLDDLLQQLDTDRSRREQRAKPELAMAASYMTPPMSDEKRREIQSQIASLANRAGASVDQIQSDFEARIQDSETAEAPAEPVAGGSGDATVATPPASVAPQPAKPPPTLARPDGDEDDDDVPDSIQRPLAASYNPVSKYGVKLFEARKRFK